MDPGTCNMHYVKNFIYLMMLMALGMECCVETNVTHSPLSQLITMMKESGENYQLTPTTANGGPVIVNISVYINTISEIDELKMDFSVNVFLRQIWQDSRFSFKDVISNVSSITLPDGFHDVWSPDTFIENGKEEKLHDITQVNKMIRVYSDGKVYNSQRITCRLWCPLTLHKFPLDKQMCQLKLELYRYSTNEVILQWDSAALENVKNIELPKFNLENTSRGVCTKHYVSGGYSCLYLVFYFSRQFGYYLAQIYIPTALIVFLSWVSFFLDPQAVPARVSLGLLTILSMSTQMSSATSSLPIVSYVKAIDVWLTVCLSFLFAALLEFAMVNSIARKQESAITNRTMNHDDNDTNKQKRNGSGKTKKFSWKITKTFLHSASGVDILSRVLFPLCFLLFNIVYWLFYTN